VKFLKKTQILNKVRFRVKKRPFAYSQNLKTNFLEKKSASTRNLEIPEILLHSKRNHQLFIVVGYKS